MATKIKALSTIIEWDAEMGRMAIINPGDSDEVGDTLAADKIESGEAALDSDEGAPAGSGETIAEARARYVAAFGKRPFPGWSIADINAKISAASVDTEADADAPSETDSDEGAPA